MGVVAAQIPVYGNVIKLTLMKDYPQHQYALSDFWLGFIFCCISRRGCNQSYLKQNNSRLTELFISIVGNSKPLSNGICYERRRS